MRQSYLRLATRARREVARLIHGRGHKQAMRFLRKMRIRAGRLVRDIERKIEGQPDLVQAFEPKLERIKQFLAEKAGICRKFRVRAITMAKKETSYGETEATSYFRRAA